MTGRRVDELTEPLPFPITIPAPVVPHRRPRAPTRREMEARV